MKKKSKNKNHKKIKRLHTAFTVFSTLFLAILLIIIGLFFYALYSSSLKLKIVQVASQVVTSAETVKSSLQPAKGLPPEPADIPEAKVTSNFSARSYIVYDVNTKKIVSTKNPDKKLPNASTTKITSAILADEFFELDDILQVPKNCTSAKLALEGKQGNDVGLLSGQKFYFKDLLYAMLLKSASDATCTVVANFKGGEKEFILKMNQYAKDNNLLSTKYQNPYGYDLVLDNKIKHYSSSLDILKTVLKAKTIETLNTAMQTREYSIKDLQKGTSYYLANTNELLYSLPNIIGYKTGTTDLAKECLALGYKNKNEELVVIILGSNDRYKDTKELLSLYSNSYK